MPQFKTTHNILKIVDEDELYHTSQYDRDTAWIPARKDWDYKREMTVEDVDIWECILEASGGIGVYAAHTPYAEFYMITTGWDDRIEQRVVNGKPYNDRIVETYYGVGANEQVIKRCVELNFPKLEVFNYWVDDQDMWLYQPKKEEDKKLIILPY